MVAISKVLSGGEDIVIKENFAENVPNMIYAPITSVDVERTFSMYKTLLADNRQRFQFENLSKIFFVYCNPE